MVDDLVIRAHRLDLSGMNFAGLARLSFEVEDEDETPEADEQQESAASDTPKKPFRPTTGRDIKGRDEQVKDGRKFVENNGGNYIDTYDEPDTSAWKRKRVRLPDGRVVYRVIRPVYEEALNDLRRGIGRNGERLDGLIVYDIDRLTRDNRDLEDAIDTVTKFNRPILDYTGTLDLLTENGRMVARMLVAAAAKQSADTSRRVKRKHQAIQQAGIPAGGSRPFGWNDDKRTLHPVESVHLREAVRRILTGVSVGSIAASWNDDGVKTAKGNKWTRYNLIGVLRNPRMCGYRMMYVHNYEEGTGSDNHYVEVCYDEHGEPVIGQWEPMITIKEWDALREIIGAAPKRGDGHNSRKYLLPGTLRCGRDGCDALLRATKAPPSRGKSEGFFYYSCPDKSAGGCGGVRIEGPATDDYVTKLVIAKYEQQTAKRQATAAPVEWDKQWQLDRVHEDMAALKAARRAVAPQKPISAERYYADLAELEAEERELKRDRNAFTRSQYAAAGKTVDLRADWNGMSLTEKRSHIERLLSAVTVLPTNGRRNVPVADRLIPVPVPDDHTV